MNHRHQRHFPPLRGGRPPKSNLRATVTMYGDDPELIDFVEVVIHSGDGKVVAVRTWDSDRDVERATDEMMSFVGEYGVTEIRQVDAVLKPEFCPDCGQRTYRIVTDGDARQAGAATHHSHT